MTVRPADMLTMLPRLNEASRLQHHQDTRPQVAAHGQAVQMQQKAERDLQQVARNSGAQQASITKDGGRRGGGDGRAPGERGAKGEPPKQEKPSLPGGQRLDVKV